MSTGNPLADSLRGQERRESRQKADAHDAATGGESTTRLNAEVPDSLYEAFREVCEAHERTISGEIRHMLRRAVQEHRAGP